MIICYDFSERHLYFQALSSMPVNEGKGHCIHSPTVYLDHVVNE